MDLMLTAYVGCAQGTHLGIKGEASNAGGGGVIRGTQGSHDQGAVMVSGACRQLITLALGGWQGLARYVLHADQGPAMDHLPIHWHLDGQARRASARSQGMRHLPHPGVSKLLQMIGYSFRCFYHLGGVNSVRVRIGAPKGGLP